MPELRLSRSGRFASEAVGAMEGFAFSGPFDDILRRIGPAWLASVWTELAVCLRAHDVDPEVLTWGVWHPAYSSGSAHVYDAPLGVFGWAMPGSRRSPPSLLWSADEPYAPVPRGERIEQDLRRAGVPVTLASGDIRSALCRRVVGGVDVAPIPPGDTDVGLELLVDHCDDAATWAPGMYNPWIRRDHTCGRIALNSQGHLQSDRLPDRRPGLR